MEEEVFIKEEPLDEIVSVGSCESPAFTQRAADFLQVEYEENSINDMDVDHVEETMTQNIPTDDRLSILAEKSNLITVCASEHIKIEDELCLIEQSMNEEDHAYARLDDDTELKPSIFSNASESKATKIHDCRKNCGRKFSTLTERALHEAHEHKNALRITKCNFCNKSFDSFFALTRHMPEHRNVQRYVCTHCSECYTSYQDLQNHWKTSSNCYKEEELDIIKKTPEIVLEEPRKISILKPSKPRKASPIKALTTASLQSQPRSFAEEIKAFAAKYQLKSIVAKKRTSAVVIDPTNTKKSKKSKHENFVSEIISEYKIPNAIGPVSCGIANPLLNVKIKEEPLDEYDEQFLDSNPEIQDGTQINSEPINDYIEIKNEPIDDPIEETTIPTSNNKYFYSNSIGNIHSHPEAILPTTQQNTSNPLKNFKVIKLDTTTNSKLETEFRNTNAMGLKNIKILKLAPNAKIIRLPTIKVESINNSNEKPSTENEKSQATTEFVPIKLPNLSAQANCSRNEPVSENPALTIKEEKEDEEDEEENIDSSSITKLVEHAISTGQRKKRINCVPKEVLRFIEQQPQKIKIIEDLQRQIQIAESISAANGSKDQESCYPNIASNPVLPAPVSFYLLITDNNHPELSTARREYHNYYRFSWMCPRCPKRYDQKHAFLGHLVRAHDMCRDEFKNLMVEVRPFRIDKAKNIKKYQGKKQQELNSEATKELSDKEKKKEPSVTSQYQCSYCKRICSSRTMLNDHIAGDCGRVPMYQCTSCPKAFFSASTLSCHITIHTGELPHKCNYCDKRFRTRGQVTVHHRTHTGERPFSCQICSQRFTHRETLISHLSRHIGMKRYRCYACGKHFSCVSGLKTHHELRPNTCGLVKLNTRAVGPRVRVVRGQVMFEPQPEINPYLRTEDPQDILSEIQNIQKTNS